MGIKILRFRICHGSTGRHALFRALVIASALSVVPLMEIMRGTEVGAIRRIAGHDPALNLAVLGPFLFSGTKLFFDRLVEPFWGKTEPGSFLESANLTASTVAELMDLKLLNYDAKVLCIGRGLESAVSAFKELGFPDTHGVYGHPLFSFKNKKLVYKLEFSGNSFDFVFCGDLDKVTSPALVVLEMERVVKPGGIGAVLLSSNGGSSLNGPVKSATSISSWLKESEIVLVNFLDEFTVVVFKRNAIESASYFGKSQLPSNCESITNNKPYIELMEPILGQKPADFPKSVNYLPKFIDVSLKKRLVYIDVGAAEQLNSNLSSSWFLPSYPVDSKAFNVYFVDHNTSIMLSYVKKPGITFIYHPGLAGGKAEAKNINAHEDLDPFPEDEGFDFFAWFKETAEYADFLVLKMNTSEEELKFLSVLLETGAICSVDELFLRCSNRPECINIFRSLRSRGVFVHQWWGD